MSQENVEIVRRWLAILNTGSIPQTPSLKIGVASRSILELRAQLPAPLRFGSTRVESAVSGG